MRKNAEKMDLSFRNRLLRVPTGSHGFWAHDPLPDPSHDPTLTLGGSLYPWHSLVVVLPANIEFGEDFGLLESVDDVCGKWKWVAVLDRDLVELAMIC